MFDFFKDTATNDSLHESAEMDNSRVYNGVPRAEYTPEAIDSLRDDEVFVFGSNLQGHHEGGAAYAAMKKFGAIWGLGVGLQGQSYAIPTMQGGVETIKPYVDQFIDFARKRPELFFYVTRIGCGIAGFEDSEIAPLFKAAVDVENICLPKSFAEEFEGAGTPDVPRELVTMMYGQVRTLIDLLKELNKQEPIHDSDDAIRRLEERIEWNVRLGDSQAFMALRAIRGLMYRYEREGKKVDIEQMEKDMLSYHAFKTTDSISILYNYSVRKMIKYIQFLNEFRRYTNYEMIRCDLRSIPFNRCSSNDPEYYYSFNQYTIWDIERILSLEWNNVTKNGRLDNELLEQVVFGRFDKMVAEHGLKETIRLAYDDVGCRSNIKVPKRQEEIIWGPAYYIDGSHIEKGCSDFRHGEWSDTSFEMDFAHEILERDENYVHIESSIQGELYLPRFDYSLPVYSRDMGKMYFNNQEEKVKFIEAHKPK